MLSGGDWVEGVAVNKTPFFPSCVQNQLYNSLRQVEIKMPVFLIRQPEECCSPCFFESKMPVSIRCTTKKHHSQLNYVMPSDWKMHPNFRDVKIYISEKC